MQFRDLKQHSPVYVLDKDKLTLTEGKAVTVGFPRMHMDQKSGQNQMVIDLDIELDGKTIPFAVPEYAEVTHTGNLALAAGQNELIREIKALDARADQVLNSIDYYKKVKSATPGLLANLSPEYKERQETEQRFTNLENSVKDIKTMMSDFIKKFES